MCREEFGYQLVLRQFGALDTVDFSPPLDLVSLTAAAIIQDSTFPVHLDRDEMAQKVARKLQMHSELLDEYFSIRIVTSPTGTHLTSLPVLLPLATGAQGGWQKRLAGHGIQPARIPSLLIRLATTIDWTEEDNCLSGVARAIGRACVPPPNDGKEDGLATWSVQHVWFPAMHARRGAYLPSSKVQPTSVFKVAAMSDLYRVFERC